MDKPPTLALRQRSAHTFSESQGGSGVYNTQESSVNVLKPPGASPKPLRLLAKLRVGVVVCSGVRPGTFDLAPTLVLSEAPSQASACC